MRSQKYQKFPLFDKQSPRRGEPFEQFLKFLGSFIHPTILHPTALCPCNIWHRRCNTHLEQLIPDRSTAVRLACWNADNARVIKFRVPQGSISGLLLFVSCATDHRTSSSFRLVCRSTVGVNRLMSACSKPTCHGASTTCGGGCVATGCS